MQVELRKARILVDLAPAEPSVSVSASEFNHATGVGRTLIDEHLSGAPSAAGRYNHFKIETLRSGPSGACGKTHVVQILGPDKSRGPIAFMKRVNKKEMVAFSELKVHNRIAMLKAGRPSGPLWEFKPFIMDVEAVCSNRFPEEPLDFIFEMCDCTLYDVRLNIAEWDVIPSLKRWSAQAIGGLGFIHSIGVIHRDIKPENILLDWRQNIRITDFDMSYVLTGDRPNEPLDYSKNYCSHYCGSVLFAAPEIKPRNPVTHPDPLFPHLRSLLDRAPFTYGPKVDFYAFGVTLYELCRSAYHANRKYDSKEFYEHLSNLHAMLAAESSSDTLKVDFPTFRRLLNAENITDYDLQTLIAHMIHPVAANRADFQRLTTLPWFREDRMDPITRRVTPNVHVFSDIRARSAARPKAKIPTSRIEPSPRPYKSEKFSQRAYYDPKKSNRRYTWINVESKLFDFIDVSPPKK